jgi:hypothetical protein
MIYLINSEDIFITNKIEFFLIIDASVPSTIALIVGYLKKKFFDI